jgi:hypothetical protein
MATKIISETLENLQRPMQLILETGNYTFVVAVNFVVVYLTTLSVAGLSSWSSTMALQPFVGSWPLFFNSVIIFTRAVGLLGRVISQDNANRE